MENERSILLELIERYRHLLRGVNDERLCRELERLLREAEDRLTEIERGAGGSSARHDRWQRRC